MDGMAVRWIVVVVLMLLAAAAGAQQIRRHMPPAVGVSMSSGVADVQFTSEVGVACNLPAEIPCDIGG